MANFEISNVTKDIPVFTTTLELAAVNSKIAVVKTASKDNALKNLIKDHRKQYPEGYRSNVQAWRSDWFTHKKDPRFQPFVDICTEACNFLSRKHFNADAELICSNMCVVEYVEGDWTKEHDHFPDVMSCVYFVDVEDNCAPIIFENSLEIKPENNMLIFFPSLLKHKVPPTDAKRTVISMNFRLRTCMPNVKYNNSYAGFY